MLHHMFDAPDEEPEPVLDLTVAASQVVDVTPAMAEHWLATNYDNRALKPKKIELFTRDMANGAWGLTGEPLKFDTNGDLIDGQNRLHACIRAGVSFRTDVRGGLERDVRLVMDSGNPRNTADSLRVRNWSAVKELAPAATVSMAWRDDFYKSAVHQQTPTYTHTEIVNYVELHPDLEGIVKFVLPVRRDLPLPVGALAACAMRFALIDADAMNDFYTRIQTMHTDGLGDPIATLLKRVKAVRDQRQLRLYMSTAIFFQVRAWNAWRRGESLLKFQLGAGDKKSPWVKIPKPI